jgi:hypothetical protein
MLRGIGAVSLVAFASLFSQILGLMGSQGIQPASDVLALYEQWAAGARFWRAPSLFWLGASDPALLLACGLGVLLSALLVAGLAPRLMLAALWLLYLSLATVGHVFLGYQWDALLIETFAVALLLAPPVWRERLRESPPSPRGALFLARLVLFKLMFLSGFVKLASGDETWRDLSALDFHYWTQPLPAWTSVYVDALPDLFHRASVLTTFGVELVLPFLLFIPGWPRRIAGLGLVGFQLVLIATGNFAFFNWLSIVLCLPALDDALLRRLLPSHLRERLASKPAAARLRAGPMRRAGFGLTVALLVFANLAVLAQRTLPPDTLPDAITSGLRALAPFQSVNGYGLFAVMTTERPEILVEGSQDGSTWHAYEFRWKPGDLERRPRFVAPHQPRLDWQMWFAALRGCRRAPWYQGFSKRLLEGSRPVLDLLATNPFPDSPPRYVRGRIFQYRFADADNRRTGRWWQREGPLRNFCPVLTLENGALAIAELD